jgi:hypothetical protein
MGLLVAFVWVGLGVERLWAAEHNAPNQSQCYVRLLCMNVRH